jgi:hypothetical protein
MKTLGITIAVGLGDAIFIASALHAVKHKYDKIYINARWDLAEVYKNNGKEYSDFYLEMLKLLFNDSKFIIDDKTQKFPFKNMNQLWGEGVPPVLPRFANVLKIDEKIPVSGDYLVVTTKVRQLDKKTRYNAVKEEFIKTLDLLSKKYKIVIIGEKEVEMNTEYCAYGSRHIYSIYSDVIDGVKNNIIDLTVPKLGIKSPDIDVLKRDCSIMNKSKCVITLGCGGNFVLALSVANRMVGFRYDDYKFVDHAVKGADNINITSNVNQFIKLLQRLL